MVKQWMVGAGVLGLCAALGCGDSGTATGGESSSTQAEQTTTGVPGTTTGEPGTTEEPTGAPTTSVSASGTSSGGSTGEPETTAVTATTGPGCEAPLVECGGACVDTQIDAAHCGGCDAPCDVGQLCEAGSCVLDCPEGQVACGDVCVDTQMDPAHCGGCDMPCLDTELCSAGVCALDCDPGLLACMGACVDTQTDDANCGDCGMVCEQCQECSTGACEPLAAGPAPGMITGNLTPCTNSSGPYSIAKIDGAVKYTWTVPNGSMVTAGQDTEAVTIKFGANNGKVCVTYNDGCTESLPSCVDVVLSGAAPGNKIFSYTGAAQEFVLPVCVSQVTVELSAAQGGGARCCDNSVQDDGGKGGYVKATLTGNPGDKWGVYVGGKGVTEGAGGWNGGGPGAQYGAGGGGASDVRVGGAALMNRSLVAGGGGGGNCGCPDHGTGGAGGGLSGDPGISNQGWLAPGGGTQNAGGTAGSPPAQAGSLGVGGGPANYHVAGGGGGYYGGGGAYAAGAGGGSSYYGNAMNASTVKGTRAGNGEIKFSW